MLTVPLYMLEVFDRVLASRSEETLLYLTLIAFGALVALDALDLARGRILLRTGEWLERRLAHWVFERAVTATLAARSYWTEALRDLSHVRSFLASPAVLVLFDAPWVPIYLAIVFLLHPLVRFVAVGGAAVLLILALVTEISNRAPLRAANRAAVLAMGQAEATTRNAEVIDAMGMMRGAVNRWAATSDEALHYQVQASARGAPARRGQVLSSRRSGRSARRRSAPWLSDIS
jgi:ABC-type protease/lipase transport system fused ATPase/permease subunit